MTKEELKTWFFNKYNSCYLAKHEEYTQSIFMYYDPQFIRQKKLCRLTGEQIEYPSKVSGVCLFEQDYKTGYLYMNYENITSFLFENYSYKILDIRVLINGWLKEFDNLKVLTPVHIPARFDLLLKEIDNLKVLTPEFMHPIINEVLKETDKLSILK